MLCKSIMHDSVYDDAQVPVEPAAGVSRDDSVALLLDDRGRSFSEPFVPFVVAVTSSLAAAAFLADGGRCLLLPGRAEPARAASVPGWRADPARADGGRPDPGRACFAPDAGRALTDIL